MIPPVRQPSSGTDRVNVCGVMVDLLSLDDMLDRIGDRVEQHTPGYVVTPNVDHVCLCARNAEFKEAYDGAFLRVPDGVPLLWGSRLLGTPLIQRLNGTDLVYAISEYSAARDLPVFLLGAEEGIPEQAAERLKSLYPELRIAGTYSPPMGFEKNSEDRARIITLLHEAGPDICFVALGSPKQEIWMRQHCEKSGVPLMIGVGASFDFIAGRKQRAPLAMQRMGLEWLWRLCTEPRRLWRRYLVDDMFFFVLLARQLASRLLARSHASAPAALTDAAEPGRTNPFPEQAERAARLQGKEQDGARQTAPIDGCVVIGRNEGPRLAVCLKSVKPCADLVVYADSGSCDGSPDMARGMGIETVVLDESAPFTAARGRNAGLQRLLETCSSAQFVQFVDGDCEMFEDWFGNGRSALEQHPDVAAVFGRLRERHPHKSVYGRLCHMEWNTPLGEAASCGGITMMRVSALRECGGFDETLIAGEEPELCFRLRGRGWKILRVDADMGKHDADITRFGQWWKRNVRTGHAYAECSWKHRKSPRPLWAHETRSVACWGLLLPVAALSAVWVAGWWWSLVFLAAYSALAGRVYRFMRRRGFPRADSATYAFFCALGKFPQAWGVLSYCAVAMTGRRRGIIEYKQVRASRETVCVTGKAHPEPGAEKEEAMRGRGAV